MSILINGERIEDTDISSEAERMREEYERTFADMDKDAREKQLVQWSRENVVERVLMKQEAFARFETVTEKEIDMAFEDFKKQQGDKAVELTDDKKEKLKEIIGSQIRIEKLLGQVSDEVAEPTEEEVAKFYNENKKMFTEEQQVHVGHIIKHIDWQADDAKAYEEICKVKQELDGGVVFEVLAAKMSDCPEKGGDLGFIKKGQMVEEFEDVAFKLGKNEVSNIIKTRYGYHIVKCYQRKGEILHELDEKEVRDFAVKQVWGQKRQTKAEAFVDGLKAKANIEQVTS